MLKKYFLPLAVLALSLNLGQAQANTNLVVNGGFETGNFSGWTISPSAAFTSVSSGYGLDGSTYGVAYGYVGSDNYLSQTIATVAGDIYTFSFDQQTRAGSANDFQAWWNGTEILDLPNSPVAATFTTYNFIETATSSSTEIKFGLRQDPAYSALDNISVTQNTAVPEPEMISMFALGLLGLSIAARKKA